MTAATPARPDVHAGTGGVLQTGRAGPRRRPAAVHIAPEPSWTALGHYLATR
jgi:hypothetical protein